jgi:hypothetical protein
MPAYIRLLAYFSNFILLAAFLGCGIGCLVAGARRNLFLAFPSLLVVVVAAVDLLRLEVAVPSASTIYFSSGTSDKVVAVESTMLLPLMFVVVALLFVTVAQRMARALEEAGRPEGRPLQEPGDPDARRGRPSGRPATGDVARMRDQPARLARRRRRVRVDIVAQMPPVAWFGVAFAAAMPFSSKAAAPS